MQTNSSSIEKKKKYFRDFLTQEQQKFSKLSKRTTQYGTLRFTFFLVAIVALVYFVNQRNGILSFSIVLLAPLIFGFLVNKHNQFKRLLNLSKNKLLILQQEIDRLDLKLSHLDGGEEFIDHSHPCTTDMDVFGKHSLFALINRSSLPFGREKLANWFKNRAAIATASKRQSAVTELVEDPEFLLEWWAESKAEQTEELNEKESVFQWFENSKELQLSSVLKILPVIALLQFWTIVVLASINIIPNAYIGLSLLLNMLILAPIQSKVIATQKLTDKLSLLLNQHLALFQMAQTKTLSDKYLKELTSNLRSPSASGKIKRLNKIMSWLHSRNGLMYWIVDPIFMTDYWVLISSVNWKNSFGQHIRKWFETIGELEALLSMASFSFAHENYSKPKFITDSTILEGVSIGHPLIKHHERVANDFKIEHAGSISLITGANMSGKSTFERSLGVNIILAQMGAVCCAEKLHLSSLQLFTSMRTQDNLSENTSSFYAELKRLKQLVDLTSTEKEVPIFYLLDEILKGTNSEDRNKGAESLIKQLMTTNSMGLISTHDLSLAKLTEQLDLFANYSFNSDVQGDEILFDYKLTEGPCHTFNAVPLMKKMGIHIID